MTRDGDAFRGDARLSVARDDGFTELGQVDGRYLSTDVAGGRTGRMVGVYCAAGDVVARSFEYSVRTSPPSSGAGHQLGVVDCMDRRHNGVRR